MNAQSSVPAPASDNPETIALRVIYYGRVQGVGFRYQTCRVADGFPIHGTVKNLTDGSVELIAQGEKKVVTSFLNEVSQTLSGNISSQTESSTPTQPKLQGFRIQH